MLQIDKQYIESHKDEILKEIRSGKIFIHPTDTIYGLGADATNTVAVEKIRAIKNRPSKPFSVIVPGKEWILEHCVIKNPTDLDRLPGPYTLIVNQKGKGLPTLGVRIPDHWFASIIAEAGVPFVTTSVNLAGEHHMESLEDVPQSILDQVDYVVYEGVKRGKSSEKVDLTKI